MLTEAEYLNCYKEYAYANEKRKQELKSFIINHNKFLVERYPFIKAYDGYSYTILDEMPEGWRITFAINLLEDIREALLKEKVLNKYLIYQIKEKFGGLRIYDSGNPEKISLSSIIDKYEVLSYMLCPSCGQPVKWRSKNNIKYFCDECAQKFGMNKVDKCEGR